MSTRRYPCPACEAVGKPRWWYDRYGDPIPCDVCIGHGVVPWKPMKRWQIVLSRVRNRFIERLPHE